MTDIILCFLVTLCDKFCLRREINVPNISVISRQFGYLTSNKKEIRQRRFSINNLKLRVNTENAKRVYKYNTHYIKCL